ncbi:MAG TPA: Ig-like domain-containing protein [Candidatus Baltobacteraceae bacterium]|jgi:hypothetical protein|nr:Ig-like domain-containing protein [Candidatus Baltobacteraceae bacterium]
MRRRKFLVLLFLWLICLRPALATTQLIVNGGFNSTSPAPWVLVGSGLQVVNDYLSMGNADGAQEGAYQIVTFPTNLIAATLSLDYETLSTDPNGDDTFTVYIADTDENPKINLGTATSASPTSGWVDVSTNFIRYAGQDLLSSYAGESVEVYFYVTTDPTYGVNTSFNVTDVSLVVATTADIPANDNFTNATLIPSDGITNDVTTTYASKQPGEPNIAGNVGGHSVWWNWTAPQIGTVTIATTGSSYNTLLGVFTGSAINALTVVTNSNGINRTTGLAYLTFSVTPGTQYDIALAGYNGQSGDAVFIFKFTPDKTPPTVTIDSPTPGADVSTSTVHVSGTASDNVAVASVYYQLKNANGTNAWQLATGTDKWSATVTNLIPGPNTIRVEAYDTSTNVSTVASCVVNYVIGVPFTLTIIGKGTVSGATNGQSLHLGYPYKLTAHPTPGFAFRGWSGDISADTATLSFTVESNLSLTATFVDVENPTLSITAPKTGERWSNSVFNVTGKANDNVGVANVWLQHNTQPWTSVVSSGNGWSNWNVSVTLTPGANTIRAYAVDAAGNISLTNSVSFIYVLSAPLTVQISSGGTVKPNYNNAVLEIGNNYTMTATAASGYVFSNWTATTGAVITNGPILKFAMASNLDFIANFVPNPFPSAAGTYQGLFYDTGGVAQASSGFFSAQVTDTGRFTASFQQGKKSFPISGQFSLTGGWSTDALKTWDNTAISLQLDLTGGNVLNGDLINSAWVAQLGANRAVFTKSAPSPQAGRKYTLVIPGADSTALPGGNGFGTVTVTPTGSVTFSGILGDGTAVTPTANESEQQQWPLYISLYGGDGMLLGWMTFTNEPDRDIDGVVNWFKPSQSSSALYKAGFTNAIDALGSAYSFSSGDRALDLTNGYVLIEDGGLTQSINDPFTVSPNNVVTASNKLSLTITTSTGLFKGSATNAQGKTISFKGAVLQKQTNGFGQFLNGAQSGSVYLAPQ